MKGFRFNQKFSSWPKCMILLVAVEWGRGSVHGVSTGMRAVGSGMPVHMLAPSPARNRKPPPKRFLRTLQTLQTPRVCVCLCVCTHAGNLCSFYHS